MSDTISFACPHCSTRLDVPAELAGVSGPCPRCAVTISAPEASTLAPATVDKAHDTRHIPAQDTQQSEPALSDTSLPSRNWSQAVRSGVIGFLSVVLLAAATWGIAKALKKDEKTEPLEIAESFDRIVPKATPLTIEPVTKREITITDDGKVKEDDIIFPITNKVEPPAIDLESSSTTLFTPGNVIDENRAELANLLDDSPEPSALRGAPLRDNEKIAIESRKLISDFLAAKTLEERLPKIFSERIPAGEMSERFANTMLDKPIELAKTLDHSSIAHFGYEGPNAAGITQQYFIVTIAEHVEGSIVPRNIVIHMANHLDGKYRINADAFLFSMQNQLEQFANNPHAEPLIAYLFLERCHYKAGAEESPSGTFSVRLLTAPLDQSSHSALVDTMRSSGEVLNPVVKWGVPPRAAIVELKHETNASSDETTITINRLLKLNWLQSYEATSTEEE